MKRTILLSFALIMSVLSHGYDFKVDGLQFTILTESTVSCVADAITAGVKEFIVPATVTYDGITYTVTEIGTRATSGGNYIGENYGTKSIKLPNTIVKIDSHAFSSCKGINTEVIIPASVVEIGDNAFSDCRNIPAITFEENSSLTTIGPYAFDLCEKVKEFRLPPTVTNIGDKTINGGSVFTDCHSLETIILPDGIEILPRHTFYECRKLKNVRLPKSLIYIGDHALAGCDSLKSIVIPEHVTEIEEGSFDSGNLTDIYFIGECPTFAGEVMWFKTAEKVNVYVKESLVESYENTFKTKPKYLYGRTQYQIPYSSTLKLSTYYREFDSDFHVAAEETNIKPFVATGYDSQKAYLTSIDNGIVPKECGVVIRNNTGNTFWYQIAEVQGNPQPAVNYLKGFCWEQTLNPTEDDGSVNYVLYNGKFCIFDNTGQLSDHKAYLQLPASAGSKQITMSFADEPSGIGEVEAGEEQKVYYNLSGMRVEKPKKGVYVQNGKKIIFK